MPPRTRRRMLGARGARSKKLKWDLVGEKAKFEKALGDIQQLERRLSVYWSRRVMLSVVETLNE
jgi:hypothetical protein